MTGHWKGLGLNVQWFSARDSVLPFPKGFQKYGAGEEALVTMNRLSQGGLQVWRLLEFSSQGVRGAKYPVIHRTLPLEEEVSL